MGNGSKNYFIPTCTSPVIHKYVTIAEHQDPPPAYKIQQHQHPIVHQGQYQSPSIDLLQQKFQFAPLQPEIERQPYKLQIHQQEHPHFRQLLPPCHQCQSPDDLQPQFQAASEQQTAQQQLPQSQQLWSPSHHYQSSQDSQQQKVQIATEQHPVQKQLQIPPPPYQHQINQQQQSPQQLSPQLHQYQSWIGEDLQQRQLQIATERQLVEQQLQIQSPPCQLEINQQQQARPQQLLPPSHHYQSSQDLQQQQFQIAAEQQAEIPLSPYQFQINQQQQPHPQQLSPQLNQYQSSQDLEQQQLQIAAEQQPQIQSPPYQLQINQQQYAHPQQLLPPSLQRQPLLEILLCQNTLKKKFKCTVCSKSFNSKQHLKQHKEIHSGIKRFQCSLCPMAFAQLTHVKQHERFHLKERIYACKYPECPSKFTQQSNLRAHQQKHNSGKYKCSGCSLKFGVEGDLYRHILTHTQKNTKKKFVCLRCGLGYVDQVQLERHYKHRGHTIPSAKQYEKKVAQLPATIVSNFHPVLSNNENLPQLQSVSQQQQAQVDAEQQYYLQAEIELQKLRSLDGQVLFDTFSTFEDFQYANEIGMVMNNE